MKRKQIYWYLCVIFCCALLLLFVGLFRQQSSLLGDTTFRVVCTTTIIADAVRHVAQGLCVVDSLMGPGIDPHLYRARESDVHKLAAAHLIFYNGLHLEGKMSDIFAHMTQHFTQQAVAVSNGLAQEQLLALSETMYDPHIWHDVQLWQKVVLFIGNSLARADPVNAVHYCANAQQYIKELEQLDGYVREQIAQLPSQRRILITAHDAFSYFGRAYGITVVGLQGVSTQVQVGTKDIQNLADYIVRHKIPALFVESSVPERTLTAVKQAVASRGWYIEWGDQLYSDALGLKDSPAGTYAGMIRHNVDAIVKELNYPRK